MGMAELDRAFQFIKENPGEADFLEPREEELIHLSESVLNVTFPPTYRRFVLQYGCGDIAGEEYYGVIDEIFMNRPFPMLFG